MKLDPQGEAVQGGMGETPAPGLAGGRKSERVGKTRRGGFHSPSVLRVLFVNLPSSCPPNNLSQLPHHHPSLTPCSCCPKEAYSLLSLPTLQHRLHPLAALPAWCPCPPPHCCRVTGSPFLPKNVLCVWGTSIPRCITHGNPISYEALSFEKMNDSRAPGS